MKRILVACDFSEGAIEAYRMAQSLAAMSSAEVFVLRMIDLPFLYETTFGVQPIHPTDLPLQEFYDQAKEDYNRLRERHHNGIVTETFVVERGPVASGITSKATQLKAELVVIGAAGGGGVADFLMGSNANKVIRSCQIPVLCVKKAVPFLRNIVFAVDTGIRYDALIPSLKEIQRVANSKIQLLIVNTPANFKIGNEAETALREFIREYGLEGTINVRNYYNEWEGIVHFANEVNADLIAMETHGRKGIRHLMAGSITEHVTAHAPCPVLSVVIPST